MRLLAGLASRVTTMMLKATSATASAATARRGAARLATRVAVPQRGVLAAPLLPAGLAGASYAPQFTLGARPARPRGPRGPAQAPPPAAACRRSRLGRAAAARAERRACADPPTPPAPPYLPTAQRGVACAAAYAEEGAAAATEGARRQGSRSALEARRPPHAPRACAATRRRPPFTPSPRQPRPLAKTREQPDLRDQPGVGDRRRRARAPHQRRRRRRRPRAHLGVHARRPLHGPRDRGVRVARGGRRRGAGASGARPALFRAGLRPLRRPAARPRRPARPPARAPRPCANPPNPPLLPPPGAEQHGA
jgi:hypothetical protein